MTRRGPDRPLHSSFKSRSLCQTLSDALDISRKTARVPLDGNSSKAVYIYAVHISSNISFSNNLPQIGSSEIGRYFFFHLAAFLFVYGKSICILPQRGVFT